MSNEMDRRRFLGIATGAAAGAILAPVLSGCGPEEDTPVVDGETLELERQAALADFQRILESPEDLPAEEIVSATARAMYGAIRKDFSSREVNHLDPAETFILFDSPEDFSEAVKNSGYLTEAQRLELTDPNMEEDRRSSLGVTDAVTGEVYLNVSRINEAIASIDRTLAEGSDQGLNEDFVGLNTRHAVLAKIAAHELVHSVPLLNGLKDQHIKGKDMDKIYHIPDAEVRVERHAVIFVVDGEDQEGNEFREGATEIVSTHYGRQMGIPAFVSEDYGQASFETTALNRAAGLDLRTNKMFAQAILFGQTQDMRYVLEQYGRISEESIRRFNEVTHEDISLVDFGIVRMSMIAQSQ